MPTSATTSTSRARTSGGEISRRDRLVGDERGEDQQRHAVRLRGEDLHAPEAERHRPGGRSRGQAQREQREADRAGVGEHVPGVGEQRERVREDAGRHLERP